MRYLALGDSISIDDYTGVEGGGAASQFGRRLPARDALDVTRDGCVSSQLIDTLDRLDYHPDVVTVTIGGNDLLSAYWWHDGGTDAVVDPSSALTMIEDRLRQIALRLAQFGAVVIWNNVYDPTDGDASHARQFGLPESAAALLRALNEVHERIAQDFRFRLCRLDRLFQGHGYFSSDPWIVKHIEPNLVGATKICDAWLRIARS